MNRVQHTNTDWLIHKTMQWYVGTKSMLTVEAYKQNVTTGHSKKLLQVLQQKSQTPSQSLY